MTYLDWARLAAEMGGEYLGLTVDEWIEANRRALADPNWLDKARQGHMEPSNEESEAGK